MLREILTARSRLLCVSIFFIGFIIVTLIRNHHQYPFRGFHNPRDVCSDQSSSSGCTWIFDRYVPSPWESFWSNNITSLQSRVCPTLQEASQLSRAIQTLEKIIAFQSSLASDTTFTPTDDSLFSKMLYRYDCANTSYDRPLVVAQYIEPLIGLIRDPLTICSYPNSQIPVNLSMTGEYAVQSKRFLLLGPSAPYNNFNCPMKLTIAPWLYQPGTQKILFDVGASLFNGLNHQTQIGTAIGARWFYDYFRSISLQFDRIIAIEHQAYGPRDYWNQIPGDLMGKLTFINVGVDSQGKFNPWSMLQNIAKKQDYVIVKLDIDTRPLEMALIQQILETPAISSLIDEMFFEMHVTIPEMQRFWGSPGGSLQDTYQLFSKLRGQGIRMHSWP